MKDRIKGLRGRIYIGQMALLAILPALWWGILYPDLSMTEDTFQAVSQEQAGDCRKVQMSGADVFFAILEAAPEEIEIRSKFIDTFLRGKEDE